MKYSLYRIGDVVLAPGEHLKDPKVKGILKPCPYTPEEFIEIAGITGSASYKLRREILSSGTLFDVYTAQDRIITMNEKELVKTVSLVMRKIT